MIGKKAPLKYQQSRGRANSMLFGMLFCIILPLSGICKFSDQDTIAIHSLIDEAAEMSQTNPDNALKMFNSAEKQSKSVDYAFGIAKAKLGQANILFGKNIKNAIILSEEVLILCKEKDLQKKQVNAEALLLMAAAYEEQGQSDSSAYYYYYLGREIENGLDVKPAFAVDLYTKLAIFWLNLYYGSRGNTEYQQLVFGYVQKARAMAELLIDKKDAVSSTYFLEGAYYHALEKYDSARFFYINYLKDRDALGKITWQRKASCYVNIAETYLNQKDAGNALKSLQKSKEILRTPMAVPYSGYFDAFTDLMIAKAYFLQGKHLESVELIESSLKRLKGTSEKVNLMVAETYNTASLSYEALGDFSKALSYKDQYFSLHDSLMKRENLNMINGLEIRYRMAEKDKEIAESKLAITAAGEKVRARNQMIGVTLSVILIGGLFWFLWNRKNRHKERLQSEKLYSLKRTLEVERLNATLSGEEMERKRIARELHDGVGGLLAAAKMNFELFEKKNANIDKVDLSDGIDLLQQASTELRKTAHNLMPEILLQEGLPKAVQSYCSAMSGKNGPNIQVQILGEIKSFPSDFEFSVYRIIQELVNNIIRHSHASEGLVELSFREDGGLNLTIEDNGIGLILNNEHSDDPGMGIFNIKQRIKAIDGILDIQSNPGSGTSFFIEIDPNISFMQSHS